MAGEEIRHGCNTVRAGIGQAWRSRASGACYHETEFTLAQGDRANIEEALSGHRIWRSKAINISFT